jgi:dUTPase
MTDISDYKNTLKGSHDETVIEDDDDQKVILKIFYQVVPRSNSPARKRLVPDNYGGFVEAVFRPEIFRIFSNAFRPVPVGKHRRLVGIYRKKSEKFPAGILLSCSSDFRWPESST